MKLLFIIIINIGVYSQNNTCKDFLIESKNKLAKFQNNTSDFDNPFYLSKKELFSIVSPEYLTFSSQKNDIEIALVKSNLFMKSNKMDLSFGPFQMKLSFILETINKTPIKIIKDPILIELKVNKEVTCDLIEYLNKVQTQWNILRLFEYCNKKIYSQYSIRGLYTIYNRGNIKKNKTVFNKILCQKKSYEDWCEEFLGLE